MTPPTPPLQAAHHLPGPLGPPGPHHPGPSVVSPCGNSRSCDRSGKSPGPSRHLAPSPAGCAHLGRSPRSAVSCLGSALRRKHSGCCLWGCGETVRPWPHHHPPPPDTHHHPGCAQQKPECLLCAHFCSRDQEQGSITQACKQHEMSAYCVLSAGTWTAHLLIVD